MGNCVTCIDSVDLEPDGLAAMKTKKRNLFPWFLGVLLGCSFGTYLLVWVLFSVGGR